MGGAVSYAAAAMGGGGGGDGMKKEVDAVDWLNLPCPVKYEEIQRENISKWNEVLFPPCHHPVSVQRRRRR